MPIRSLISGDYFPTVPLVDCEMCQVGIRLRMVMPQMGLILATCCDRRSGYEHSNRNSPAKVAFDRRSPSVLTWGKPRVQDPGPGKSKGKNQGEMADFLRITQDEAHNGYLSL